MKGRGDLRAVQNRLVDELKDSAGVAVVLGMGGGKTVTALTALRELLDAGVIRAAVVLAPKRVALSTWPDELPQWSHLARTDMVVLSGPPKRREARLAEQHEIYVCGIDNLDWLLDAMPKSHPARDQLVIDELSKLKSPRGSRAKKLLRQISTFGAVWGLTGTPRPNGWEDLWMPLQIISKRNAFGECGFDAWRRGHFMQMDYHGYRWEATEQGVARIQRTAGDWMVTIPLGETVDVPFVSGPAFDIVVPLTPEQETDAETMERDLLVSLGRHDGGMLDLDTDDPQVVVALSSGVASGKLSQIMQGFLYREPGDTSPHTYEPSKRAALADWCEDLGGEPLVICYWFQEDLANIRAAVPNVEVLGAGTSDKAAADIIARWNGGEIERLALHPASAGHGLNLQFGGSRMLWYAVPWSPELYAQTVKRLARPGQKNPVFVHRMVSDHPYERVRIARVERKLAEELDFAASTIEEI